MNAMRYMQNDSKISNDNAKQTWINRRVKAEEFIEKTLSIIEMIKIL
jgi:hypothetical protein